ncbi:uncharacterized protein si:ch1073-59l16.1 [Danio aesculapii]|uniref:uncharacterized protein si:ch1073-59l16.1 n=1 Tax=Danio aesculapii TaxID=1142201 RepID=UPI0024BF2B9F|nr:uncharacterized protein si:ch1073-59l16.1 [Danio aesculapii]
MKMKMKMWALLLLLLTHTSGAEDISTVSKVSVGEHQNITIPCVYAKELVGFRKYVSSGDLWLFSGTVSSRRVCVVEHREQHFFTLTLSDARSADSGRYWCAVEKYGPDLHAGFDITVTEGPSALHVSSQSVSVSEGSDVTLLCTGASHWCSVGGSCVEKHRGTLNKADVTLSRTAGVLNVTMKSLQTTHSGWYYCTDQNTQIPVQITVKKNDPAGEYNNTEHSWSGEAVGSSAAVCVCVALLLLICGVCTLTRVRRHTRHTADSADPPEGTQQILISSITEKRTNKAAESDLYVCMSGVHLKQQENGHNTEDTSENLYEIMSEIKQSDQAGGKAKSQHETPMTGITQNIQVVKT